MFTDEQRDWLRADLDPKMIERRDIGRGKQARYIPGHAVIAQANRIFGFDGWESEVLSQGMHEIETGNVATNGAVYWCQVRVRVWNGDRWIAREGVGVHPIQNSEYEKNGRKVVNDNVHRADQQEMAQKAAETDALKRAFRTWGQQFGNGLYDEDGDVYRLMATMGQHDGDVSADPNVSSAPSSGSTPGSTTSSGPSSTRGGSAAASTASRPSHPDAHQPAPARAASSATPAPAAKAAPAAAPSPQTPTGGTGVSLPSQSQLMEQAKEKCRRAAAEQGYNLRNWKDWCTVANAVGVDWPAEPGQLTIAYVERLTEEMTVPAEVADSADTTSAAGAATLHTVVTEPDDARAARYASFIERYQAQIAQLQHSKDVRGLAQLRIEVVAKTAKEIQTSDAERLLAAIKRTELAIKGAA